MRRAQRLALSACGRGRGRFLSGSRRRRAALTAPLPAAPCWRSWRRLSRAAALAATWHSAASLPWRRLALPARCVVLSCSRSLRVVVGAVASSLGAVAIARRSRRRCLQRRAGTLSAGLVVPPRSRRRGTRLPLFRGGGSLFRGGGSLSWRSAARALCVWPSARTHHVLRRLRRPRDVDGACPLGRRVVLAARAPAAARARLSDRRSARARPLGRPPPSLAPQCGDCALRSLALAGLWVGGWWKVPSLPSGRDASLASRLPGREDVTTINPKPLVELDLQQLRRHVFAGRHLDLVNHDAVGFAPVIKEGGATNLLPIQQQLAPLVQSVRLRRLRHGTRADIQETWWRWELHAHLFSSRCFQVPHHVYFNDSPGVLTRRKNKLSFLLTFSL